MYRTEALALYENCVRYRQVGCTGWWSLEVFRGLMGVKEEEYPQFPELNRRVIKIAIQQVNDESDIHLEIEFRRERRRVTDLRFTVRDNPKMALFQSPQQVLENLRQEEEAIPGAVESGPSIDLIELLEAAGISNNQVRRLTKEFDEQHIRRNFAAFEADRAAGKVTRNPSGYLLRAIREDFAAHRQQPASTPATPAHKATEADPALTTKALTDYQHYLESVHLDAYRALPATDRASLEQALATSTKNPVDQKILAERGIEGDRRLRERFVKLLARQKIGQPLEFAAWANKAGYQLAADSKAKHAHRVIGSQNS